MNPELFTRFYLPAEKIKFIETYLHVRKAENVLVLNPQLFCQQVDKKYPLVE